MRRLSIPLCLAVLLAAGPAWADAAQQIRTAEQHANMAAASKDRRSAQGLLRKAVNCLVGEGGLGYTINEPNPCRSQGKGAVNDLTDPSKSQFLQQALGRARMGLNAADSEETRRQARMMAEDLRKAM